jgi:hypothetical protein
MTRTVLESNYFEQTEWLIINFKPTGKLYNEQRYISHQ